MGQIFIICGPPGSGKTTLLKMITEKAPHLEQLQRITTREQRPEEGDKGKSNAEYEFLTLGEFASRLAHGHVANFIEWDQRFYATDIQTLENAVKSPKDYVLHEDMPSAVQLKRRFGSCITIILLFTDNKDELLRLEFALLPEIKRASIREWQRRLDLKYSGAKKRKAPMVTRSQYIEKKMKRALPDLAFMAGRFRAGKISASFRTVRTSKKTLFQNSSRSSMK
jgi:guanylate kinase